MSFDEHSADYSQKIDRALTVVGLEHQTQARACAYLSLCEARICDARNWQLGQGQQTRVFERGHSVTEPGEILSVCGEGNECVHTLLPDKHHHVPPFIVRTDEKRTALAHQKQFSAARSQCGNVLAM